MSMSIKRIVDIENDVTSQFRCMFDMKNGNRWTQKKFLEEKSKIMKALPKGFPEKYKEQLNWYFRAMLDCHIRDNIIFLYKIGDVFFYANEQDDTMMPKWDTLPRGMWNSIFDYGGLFYKNTHEEFYIID